MEWRTLGKLRDAFEESRLPFRVDVLDWHDISDNFREIIRGDCTVIKAGNQLSKLTLNKWPTKHFGDCATLIRESVSPSSVGDVPYIGLEHIGEGTLSLVNHGVASDVTSTKSSFKQGDILFGKLRPYFRKITRAPFDGICSTDIWVIQAKDGIDQEFLFYCMASEAFVDFATNGSEGTRMPRAKWEYVSRYKLPVPTLREQQKISRILGYLDEKIELNRRTNGTLEAMAQALFKSWFVDFDPVRAKMEGRWRPGESLPGLPAHLYGFFSDRLVSSELGEIPEGWKVGYFSDMVTQICDNELPSSSPNTSFHHFSIPSFDKNQRPIIEKGSSIKSQKSYIPPGSVLLSKLNPDIERVWLVDTHEMDRAVCSTEFLVLKPQVNTNKYYIYFLGRSDVFRQQLKGLITGTSRSHQRAQAKSILNLFVVLPSKTMTGLFGSIVQSVMSMIHTGQRASHDLTNIRDILLPRLLSETMPTSNLPRSG